ncbi:hypothetical protein FRX31_025301 [Thalictrum thalictroides]|uniref:Ubiquitin-like protease family profile domain-containing protein n=1 Tax=Thalictrum thalictroides TaxID=46969 RepID=A0A7J6VJ15_THATH|nr:hypothetical protein FRX31_025301 [Thalictrum thalictroides]
MVNKVLEIQHENENLKLKLQELQNENAKMKKQVKVPLLDRMENLQNENDEMKKKKNYVTPTINSKFINDNLPPPFNGNETVTKVDAPNQGPTSDCGIYICEFKELLSFKKNIPNKFHEGFEEKKRVEYVVKILTAQNCSWDLELQKERLCKP